jgi:ABC-2 type transport system permease protein
MTDKVMNIAFALLELGLVLLLFKTKIILPQQPLLFFLFFINGILLAFFMNLLLSFIGFWTPEIWAPRFLFMMLVFFISGSYFPLNLLSSTLYPLLLLTPFPYLFYLPTQMLIGQVDSTYIYRQLFFSTMWVFLLYGFTMAVWKKGNKTFSFWGK